MENVNAYRIVLNDDDEDEVYTIEQMSSAGEWEVATESNSLEGAGDLLVSDFELSEQEAGAVMLKHVADLNTAREVVNSGGGKLAGKTAEMVILDEIADAMAEPTKEGDGEKELSEEEKERRKDAAEARKVLMEEAEKVEEVVIHTLQDAQRVIRAGMLLAAGAAGMIKDSGLMGHLDEPMQRLLQNLLETERGYQAELAGDDPDEDDGSSVPDLLKDFLKRSELEKAEREAEEEAERVAKAKAEAEAAAKAAAAKTAPWHLGSADDDEDEGPELSPEERAAKEAEQKKIDEFFGGSIF